MEKITENHPLSGSQNILAENIQKLKEIFPEVFSEGRVDFEKLQLLLGDLITANDELYGLNWWGKNQAIKESMKRSLGTLRPDKESSKNWDTTENIYIEGDNLEVLKLLQKSYNGKIKMIYIDPPYNTGKDFVYKDNYKDNLKNYLEQTGQIDSEGVKQSTNTKDDGRYHSNWLNMMYPRLKLARNLLTEDGVIFISIDDSEANNLKEILDEIFGEGNFITTLIWNKQHSQQQGLFKKYHEYVFLYAKNESLHGNIEGGEGIIEAGALKKISRANPASEFTFPVGVRFDAPDGTQITGIYGDSEKINVVSGKLIAKAGKTFENVTLSAGWTQKDQMIKFFNGEEVVDSKGQRVIEFFFNSTGKLKSLKERSKITPPTFLPKYGMVSEQTEHIAKLFGKPVFDNPKPIKMISDFINWFCKENDFCLDFFSGSGTIAESVFHSKNHPKFIAVQVPEYLDEKSESGKNAISLGLKNICEIGKERIRLSGDILFKEKKKELELLKYKTSLIQTEEEKEKIQELEETISKLDIGFKVFKLDSSNIEAWDSEMPDTVQDIQTRLEENRNHLKKGRNEEDLLYELLLKQGLLLTSPIEERTISGAKVYSINHGELFICMNAPITMDVVEGIGAWGKESIAEAIVDLKPVLVLKDEAFGTDDAFKTNVELRFMNEFGFAKVNTL